MEVGGYHQGSGGRRRSGHYGGLRAGSSTGGDELGLGSDSCRTWLRHAQKEDAYNREAGIWLAGYLTANNQRLFATGLRATVGHGTDVDSGIAWIDQYCQAHPQKYVMEAAWALVRELEKTGR